MLRPTSFSQGKWRLGFATSRFEARRYIIDLDAVGRDRGHMVGLRNAGVPK